LHLVRHRTALKNRISATLMTFGHPCPMADLFGVAGRKLLDSLALPEPWQASLSESLALVDDLTARVDALEVELRDLGADDPSMQLLMTVPGVGWVLAYTIASEIGDITRFATPKKLAGYTGLCPLVRQSGPKDRRGPLAKNGPKYLRWALVEAATHAARDVRYVERYERTKQRLGQLARPHEERTLPSGRPRDPFGRLTTPYEIGPPEQPPTRPCPSRRGP
jgi:transposase